MMVSGLDLIGEKENHPYFKYSKELHESWRCSAEESRLEIECDGRPCGLHFSKHHQDVKWKVLLGRTCFCSFQFHAQ